MKTSPTKEAPDTEETAEEEKPAPEVNGHTEEVEDKEPDKSEQAKDKGEEPDTNAGTGPEVPVKCLRDLSCSPWLCVLTSRLAGCC